MTETVERLEAQGFEDVIVDEYPVEAMTLEYEGWDGTRETMYYPPVYEPFAFSPKSRGGLLLVKRELTGYAGGYSHRRIESLTGRAREGAEGFLARLRGRGVEVPPADESLKDYHTRIGLHESDPNHHCIYCGGR